RTTDVREILNGIFYVLSTGPMAGAAQRPAAEEHGVGLFRPLELGWHTGAHPSRALCRREQAGREASPTTAIIEGQSAKGAQKGGPRSTHRASMRARRSRVASATSRRYAWPVAERGGACCQHSGSRRGSPGARPPHAPLVPVH